MTALKLGRLPARHDPRTLRLATYLPASARPYPPTVDRLKAVKTWPMHANDQIGDCGPAGLSHAQQAFCGNVGRTATVTDADVIAVYRAVGGYDPDQTQPDGSNPTDNGVVLLDLMNHWRKVGIGGHRIDAYVAVDPRNVTEVRIAIDLFDVLICGHNMPLAAEPQFRAGKAWTPVTGPNGQSGSWGGHCTLVGAYTKTRLRCVTWGRVQSMTRSWWDRYTDEAFAAVSLDQLDDTGRSVTGLDLDGLRADLHKVTG